MKTRGRPRHPDVLTLRQQDVLRELQRGLTNEEIAERLGISPDGVKFHVSEILARLGVSSRYEAAAWRPEPQPARRGWALALAPFALLHKVKWNAMTSAAAGVVAVALAAGIALLAWGVVRTRVGGGGTPAVRIGAAHPEQVIFATLASGEQPSTHNKWTVTVYDTAAKRVAHQFDIGDGVSDQPAQVVAAGDKLVANLTDRIVRYDLDGSNAAELWHGDDRTFAVSIASSSDGAHTAFTSYEMGDCERLARTPYAVSTPCAATPKIAIPVLDTASGAVQFALSQDDARLTGFHGIASVARWRDDGRGFVVTGNTQSDAPGTIAIVMLDGSVTLFDNREYFFPSPDGARIITSVRRDCPNSLDLQRQRVSIVDIADGHVEASVEEPNRNILPLEWSPNGSALLYGTLPIEPNPREPGCYSNASGPEEWHILKSDGTVLDIADANAARTLWYGDRAIEYRCGDQPTAQAWCQNPNQTMGATGIYIGGTHVADAISSTFSIVQQIPPA